MIEHSTLYPRHRRAQLHRVIFSLGAYLALTLTLAPTLLFTRAATAQPSEPAETLEDKLIVESQEYLIKGQEALERSDFTEALTCFSNAQRLSPDIKNLITIAGIHQRRGDCPKAYNAWVLAIRDCQECKYKDAIFQRFVDGTRPCTSSLNITSMPSAQVRLDGVDLWSTPVTIPALYGSHTLEISEPGYLSTTRRIQVESSQERVDIDITLYLPTTSGQMGPERVPSRMDWASRPVERNSNLRFKGALAMFTVSVIGTGFTTYTAIRNDSPTLVWVLGGLSASFLLGGFVLMP